MVSMLAKQSIGIKTKQKFTKKGVKIQVKID